MLRHHKNITGGVANPAQLGGVNYVTEITTQASDTLHSKIWLFLYAMP